MSQKTYIELNKVWPENDDERIHLSALAGKRIAAVSRNSMGFLAGRNYVFYDEKNKPLFMVPVDMLFDACGNHFYVDPE